MNTAFVVTNQTTHINWQTLISLIVSSIALTISLLAAWFNTLRKARVVGILSGLQFTRYSNLPGGKVTDRKIIPFLILQNIGARSAVIEFIRLKFIFEKNDIYYAYPTSFNKEKSTEHFAGFVLSKDQSWENNFPFSMRMENYNNLVNKKGQVAVEVKLLGNKSWKKITHNPFDFFSVEQFLLPMLFQQSGNESCYIWSNTHTQR